MPVGPPAKMAALQARIDLVADEVVYRLAFANERNFIPAHQRLCGQGTRIVIGGHDKSIGPSAHDREQISGAQLWHFPVLRKKITALAHRSDNIDLIYSPLTGRFTASSPYPRRDNLVIAPVKRRPNEIVHSGVDDGE